MSKRIWRTAVLILTAFPFTGEDYPINVSSWVHCYGEVEAIPLNYDGRVRSQRDGDSSLVARVLVARIGWIICYCLIARCQSNYDHQYRQDQNRTPVVEQRGNNRTTLRLLHRHISVSQSAPLSR